MTHDKKSVVIMYLVLEQFIFFPEQKSISEVGCCQNKHLAHTALVLGPGRKQRLKCLQERVSDAGRTARKLLREPGERMASIMKWQEV